MANITAEDIARVIEPEAFGYGENARAILGDKKLRTAEKESLENADRIIAMLAPSPVEAGELVGWQLVPASIEHQYRMRLAAIVYITKHSAIMQTCDEPWMHKLLTGLYEAMLKAAPASPTPGERG
jgi:hypothetical protein